MSDNNLQIIMQQNQLMIDKLDKMAKENKEILNRLNIIEGKLLDEEYMNQRILTTLKSFSESNKSIKDFIKQTFSEHIMRVEQ